MEINKDVKSMTKPVDIDMESSKYKVFVNFNIREEEGDLGVYYVYDQEVYTKDEYTLKQFKTLNNKIDGYVDIESLGLEDTKKYVLKQVGEACTETIYSGIDVTLYNGVTEHFSLTATDQTNIQSQLGSIMNFGLKSVAYHADGQNCRKYDYVDFLRIALYASKHVLEHTTYCNFLNNHIRSLSSKEEVLAVQYGMPLSDEEMAQIAKIIEDQVQELVSAVTSKFSDIVIFG